MKKRIAILAILSCVFMYSHAGGYRFLNGNHIIDVDGGNFVYYELYLDPNLPNSDDVEKIEILKIFGCISHMTYVTSIYSGSTKVQVIMSTENKLMTDWYIFVTDGAKPVYMDRVYSFNTAYSIYQSKVNELVSQFFPD